jgi:hypothetical protein
MSIYNVEISLYANMCCVLHGFQVFKNGKKIDKWEFYSHFQDNQSLNPWNAAKVLKGGALPGFSIMEKDYWKEKRAMLENSVIK